MTALAPPGPLVVTFGCRLNAYESEVIRSRLVAAGIQDTVVVNSCAVTAEAERQARQAIRRLRRERPAARIVVTGCAAQLDPARFAAMPEVDVVLGNTEKLDPVSHLARGDTSAVADIMTVSETALHLIDGFDGRARAFIQVQQGCDHRCTFCIIPFARGNNRSVAPGSVVTQVARLVDRGFAEVVLAGVDIGDYGRDLPGRPTLAALVRAILAEVPGLPRLRLSSIDPVEVDGALFALLATEPRLMPHLHLSVQAGDDLTLKRMKRRHSCADVTRLCRDLRQARPEFVFGADLIAGFPTETPAMFAATRALVAAADLTYLHVFPYSPRPGTPAARMPPVAPAEVKARAARLRADGADRLGRFLATRDGAEERVLVERPGFGRSEHYAPVAWPGGGEPGSILTLTVVGSDGRQLFARPPA
ncbi:MAG: tRNA (N(6)-L-threonylcarbamoyladenosine(37)-C(2))-methylthiotransferase MtaB [Alphaproteobacteria bacterium]|nr:tRNA (N(6)-L-threonylcarbamoyladenosine(37)-C(2))-methylthiotransferase MtaB [Alphaproteobacteria bacterium]